jgi:hypothetical protein
MRFRGGSADGSRREYSETVLVPGTPQRIQPGGTCPVTRLGSWREKWAVRELVRRPRSLIIDAVQ